MSNWGLEEVKYLPPDHTAGKGQDEEAAPCLILEHVLFPLLVEWLEFRLSSTWPGLKTCSAASLRRGVKRGLKKTADSPRNQAAHITVVRDRVSLWGWKSRWDWKLSSKPFPLMDHTMSESLLWAFLPYTLFFKNDISGRQERFIHEINLRSGVLRLCKNTLWVEKKGQSTHFLVHRSQWGWKGEWKFRNKKTLHLISCLGQILDTVVWGKKGEKILVYFSLSNLEA